MVSEFRFLVHVVLVRPATPVANIVEESQLANSPVSHSRRTPRRGELSPDQSR